MTNSLFTPIRVGLGSNLVYSSFDYLKKLPKVEKNKRMLYIKNRPTSLEILVTTKRILDNNTHL